MSKIFCTKQLKATASKSCDNIMKNVPKAEEKTNKQ